MATRFRNPGEFCWINILTPAPAEAREFFSKLLHWEFKELPGMGHIIELGGLEIGGIWDLHGPNTPPGLPPVIGVMVKAENIEATSRKIVAMGGTAQPPMEIMDQGRMAVCTDPSGAEFDLWEAKKGLGMSVDGATHGAPSWFELLTNDTARAEKFYGEVFGWDADPMPNSPMNYIVFKLGEQLAGGMMAITPEMGPMPPAWVTYFTTTNVDESTKQAVALGGTICMPAMDIPTVGRMSGVTSPQGVTFFLITYSM